MGMKTLRLIFGFMAAAAGAAALGGCAGGGFPAETLVSGDAVNETGEALTEVYIAPAFTEFWGRNALEAPLAPGETRRLDMPSEYAAEYWDVLALGETGAEYLVRGVVFARGEAAVFRAENEAGMEEDGWR